MKVLLMRASQVLALFLATCFVLAAREVNKSVPIAIEVTDERGSAIPNAKVEIISVTDADGKTVVTDINGSAQLELQAGDYDAIVTDPAFKALSRCVSVSGDNRTIKFALRVGGCPGPDPCPVCCRTTRGKGPCDRCNRCDGFSRSCDPGRADQAFSQRLPKTV
ncbi:MAG TPA: carboxypeptidase-like regulatory domain-containing protein [Methylomirabilota bacterium]|jgi:hypothetical protein|nr:carboxypeptidase-like regulatory domain-containing protein [Methylomirabilota bacterium]